MTLHCTCKQCPHAISSKGVIGSLAYDDEIETGFNARYCLSTVVAKLTGLQSSFLASYSRTQNSKWACTFDNNGCANYLFMEGKMLKKKCRF